MTNGQQDLVSVVFVVLMFVVGRWAFGSPYCVACEGTGERNDETCDACNGSGKR